MATTKVDKVGRVVEISHENCLWDGLKGEVIGESEYGTLSIKIGSSDWRIGIWPFLLEEVRFINRNGGKR